MAIKFKAATPKATIEAWPDSARPLPPFVRDYIERGAAEGTRNDTIFKVAQQFMACGYSTLEAETYILRRAIADGGARVEGEARQAIKSAFKSTAVTEPITLGAGSHHGTAAVTKAAAESDFMRALRAAFLPGESIAVVESKENDAGEWKPSVATIKTLEQWASWHAKMGDINRLFGGTAGGAFIGINPVKAGSQARSNDNVASYRHVLAEWDGADDGSDKPKQLERIIASGLPVSVIIDSGRRSIHAWVRVDAGDNLKEWERRKNVVFALLDCDAKNKDPARVSRLPGAIRTVDGEARVQQLLDVSVGANSWLEWEGGSETPPLDFDKLASFDPANDPNNLIGQRWLCKGGSLIISGQSGVGKSSLCMQTMVNWALGRAAFGDTGAAPVRPLKSLVFQSENDEGDMAEAFQGVSDGLDLTAADIRLLKSRLFIFRECSRAGRELQERARKLIAMYSPDIVWLDPLGAFVGDDLSDPRVTSEFTRQLSAISEETGVMWALMHHQAKPNNGRDGAGGTRSDMAYKMYGSVWWTNWAREVVTMTREEHDQDGRPLFKFTATKRRTRAGFLDKAGFPTDTLHLRHGDHGICWVKADAPEAEEKERKGPAPKLIKKDRGPVRAEIEARGGVESAGAFANEIGAKFGISRSTVFNIISEMRAESQPKP